MKRIWFLLSKTVHIRWSGLHYFGIFLTAVYVLSFEWFDLYQFQVHMWDTMSHSVIWSAEVPEKAQSAAFHPSGSWIAVGLIRYDTVWGCFWKILFERILIWLDKLDLWNLCTFLSMFYCYWKCLLDHLVTSITDVMWILLKELKATQLNTFLKSVYLFPHGSTHHICLARKSTCAEAETLAGRIVAQSYLFQ